MSDQEQVVVVAQPGYQVLLNVGNDCITIDSFTPVNLSQLYSKETLDNCGSLRAHLRDGNLVLYEGQDLPRDPNAQKVDRLRQSTAKHIEAQYKQTARDSNHPNMQLETVVSRVDDSSEETLQDQVSRGREEITKTDQRFRDRTAHDFSEVDDSKPPPSLDPTGTSADKSVKPMKVSMDMDPDAFVEKQRAARAKLDEEEEAAECAVREEMRRQQEQEQNDASTGGQR